MMNMDAQQTLMAAREYLSSRGMPTTTDNLNRAMMFLATGSEGAEAPAQPAARGTRAATPQGGTQNAALNATGETQPADNAVEAAITQQVEQPAAPEASMTRGDRVAAQELPVRRGSMPRAQRIDEENPEAGMFEAQPPRQAVDVDDPISLALGLGSMAAGGLAAAVPRALPQMAITLAPRSGSVGQLPAPAPMLPNPGGMQALPAPMQALQSPATAAGPRMNRLTDGARPQSMPNAQGMSPMQATIAQGPGAATNAAVRAQRAARGGPRGQRTRSE